MEGHMKGTDKIKVLKKVIRDPKVLRPSGPGSSYQVLEPGTKVASRVKSEERS